MDKFKFLILTLVFASTTSTPINGIGPFGVLPLILVPPVFSNPFDIPSKYSSYAPNVEQRITFPDTTNISKPASQIRPTPSYGYEITADQKQHRKHQHNAQVLQSSQLGPIMGQQNIQHGPNQGQQNNQRGPSQQNEQTVYGQNGQTVYGQDGQTQMIQYEQNNQAHGSYGQTQRVPEQSNNGQSGQYYGQSGQNYEQSGQNYAQISQNNRQNAEKYDQNSEHLEEGGPNIDNTDLVPLSGSNNRRQPLAGADASGGSSAGPSRPSAATPAQVAGTHTIFTSLTSFGLDLMKAIDANQKGNAVVSPFSIALVLALLQQGTEGNAQLQINNALHMTPLDARNNFKALVTYLHNRRSRNILNIASNIFVGTDYTITPQYKSYANQYFGSDLTSMNFRNAQLASKQINDWVSSTTYGNIPNLVSSDAFTGDTQLVLANAIYFKGLWNSTFNAQRTVSRPFTLATGATKMASFMHNFGKFQGGKDRRLDAQWLIMPFEDFQYSLIVLVPTAIENGVTSLLQRLTTDDILGYLRTQDRDVIISMPKFKVSIDTNLEHPLNALGIRDIFTHNSGIASLVTARGDRPRVSGALHTAVLSIDERGGSAAAATVLAVSTLSLDTDENEFRFKADRPFVAMLWDNELNVPLFVAKIADPTIVN